MLYIYLTKQPQDICPITNTKICSDIITTIDVIKKNKDCSTYQVDFRLLEKYIKLSEIEVVLSDASTYNLGEIDARGIFSILSDEELAIKEVQKIPTSKLQGKDIQTVIKVNALDFYASLYYENNKNTVEEDAIEAIAKAREQQPEVVTELTIINRIISAYNIISDIEYISINGEMQDEEKNIDFIDYLNKIIVSPIENIQIGYVNFNDTEPLQYIIKFATGEKIVRKNKEFSFIKN